MRYAYLKELYSTFTSRRTTIFLIAVLAGLYFLGLVIPQRSLLSPVQYAEWEAKWPVLVAALAAFKLTSIYSSPLAIAVEALFFLNLLLVTAKRVPALLKSIRLPDPVQVTERVVASMPVHEQLFPDGQAGIAMVRSRLQKLAFQVIEGSTGFIAVKNRYAPLGSLLFHISFLFFLVGGLFLFHTRFRGEAFVTEGQLFNGTRAEYRSVVRMSEMRKSLPEIRFVVDKIRPRFDKMESVSLETRITAEHKGTLQAGRIEVNRPFRLGATSILITDVGIAPYVEIVDRNGREILGVFVALNIIRGDEDHFLIPGTDYDVLVRFWPDVAINDAGERYTKSYDIRNPFYAITVWKGRRIVATGTLAAPSEYIDFDGKRLSIKDMRYYGRFMIVDEWGGGLLITGFIFALIGLMMKFVWPKKECLAAWNDADGRTILHIGYRVEYQKGLERQEFERILSEVR